MLNKFVLLTASVFVVSCAVVPREASVKSMVDFGNNVVKSHYSKQEKPSKVMDIYEVSARVLKYNIKRQLGQLNLEMTEAGIEEYTSKMLPKLNASINSLQRSKENVIRTKDADEDGKVSSGAVFNSPEAVSGKNISSSQLELSWNTLDFGVSYYSARQAADKVLVARERRRKAILQLLEQAQVDYWYIVAGQKYEVLIYNIIANIDKSLSFLSKKAIANSSKSELEKNRALLLYKQRINDYLRSIHERKMRLAHLMGLPPNSDYRLYNHREKLPVINLSTDQIDEFLFANHPDMRVAAYNQNIKLLDSKIAFYKLFPNLSFDIGAVNSSDIYRVNKSYGYAGVALSYNLFSLLDFGHRSDMEKMEKKFAQNTRISVAVSILTSSRIKELLYRDAMARYADNVNLHMLEKQIVKSFKSRKPKTINQYIDLVKAQVGELEFGLKRANSYSSLVKYAFSIASVLNPSDFNYNIKTVKVPTLIQMLKFELGRMPISWLRQSDRYSIPSKNLKSEVDKIFKLWRLEDFRGVKEGGDDSFKPNVLNNNPIYKYIRPELKSLKMGEEDKEDKDKHNKKPVEIKVFKKDKQVKRKAIKKKEVSTSVDKNGDEGDIYKLLEKIEINGASGDSSKEGTLDSE